MEEGNITDIPLYEIIQEIEGKHGSDVHMVIEAIVDAEEEVKDEEILRDGVPLSRIYWYCEFQDQVKVFDNISSAKHWFMNEVVFDPNKGVIVNYDEQDS